MNLKDRLKEHAAKTVLYVVRSENRPDLGALSEKKKVALECITSSVDSVNGLDLQIKQSWFNYLYYTVRMINDDEVDALAISFYDGIGDYMMQYFKRDFVEKMSPEQKEKMENWMQPKISKEVAATQDFGQYRM